MNRKQLLSLALVVLLSAGIGFAAVPFIKSFSFPAGSGDEFPRVELSRLEAGTYLWAHSLYRPTGTPDLLVVRDFDGPIRAFQLPILDGKYLMPDLEWGRWGGLCTSFGPDGESGELSPGGVIHCHDPSLSEGTEAEWQWKYTGEKLGRWTADMRQLEIAQEGRYIRLGG